MRRGAWLLALAPSLGASAWGGIVDGSELVHPGAGFELGLGAWTAQVQGPGSGFDLVPAPGGGSAARSQLELGGEGLLTLELDSPFTAGTKLEAAARIWLAEDAAGGEVRLRLEGLDGGSWKTLARSAALDAARAPRTRWLQLSTLPLLLDARVGEGVTRLRLGFESTVVGSVLLDDARVGRFEYARMILDSPSFESANLRAWRTDGLLVTAGDPTAPDGYYGHGHLSLDSWSATRAWQDLPAGVAGHSGVGRELELGAWVRPDAFMWLSPLPNPANYLELRVQGRTLEGSWDTLSSRRWLPTFDDRGFWQYLETEVVAAQGSEHVGLRVELVSELPGRVDIDFVQLGERHALDGNPKRRVGANYVGRYASPRFPGADPTPVDAQDRWRNWRWTLPSACDATYAGFQHDPDCTTSASCMRANGRRDLAISTLSGEETLPLIGAYDSRDPDVVRYHVELAEAAGIDHFVYDWQGHLLAQQSVAQGRDALNEEAFEVLMDIAEEDGRDFKVAVMYEPKVHFLGWVTGEPTFAEKLGGIADDLVWLVGAQRERRAALRRDGRLMVFLFRDEICTPDGSQCLDEAAWRAIAEEVQARTGEELFLVADLVPGADSPMQGVARWQLVDRSFLRFRTYQDAEQGTPTSPAPVLSSVEQHARAVHAAPAAWVAEDDTQRLAISIVWPGFDDSGVGGWGVSNLVGRDGGPLCVRVAEDFEGAFYPTVVASALDAGGDWLQIATWNDWNEDTRLEPAWLEGYFGGTPRTPGAIRSHVYGRLLETQAWIADFKDLELVPRDLVEVTNDYLRRAALNPSVVEYD